MLAYVFWHRPAPTVERDRYDAALVAFHQALAAAAPPGWLGSATFRVDPVPFDSAVAAPRSGDGPCYEDWYLLSGSGALDPLDDSAVGAACGPAHAEVAALAGGGTAGLYRLVAGAPSLAAVVAATWTDLPVAPARQAALDELTSTALSQGASLWMRRMTLGPAPELCLLHLSVPGRAAARPASELSQQRVLVWHSSEVGRAV
jgi:hypothetical protein